MIDSKIRVVIADDDHSMLRVLSEIIEEESELNLAGTARDAREALDLIVRSRPDVAIVDVRMPGGGGAQVIREGKQASPQTKFVALSAHTDRGPVTEMLMAGAVGYLVKGLSVAEVVEAIKLAAAGRPIFSSDVTPAVLQELSEHYGRREKALTRRRARLAGIKHLLDTRAIKCVFQPIVELLARSFCGFEALARFEAPNKRTDQLLSEATSLGLGIDLELLAAETAVSNIASLPPDAYMSINVGPQAAVSPRILAMLSKLPLHRLVLEITEHARVQDYGALERALKPLRRDGLRVAVDDAGAGFASLSHILRLAPDFIKLDISLTRGIEQDLARRALARGLISFADEMDVTIIAEGIETLHEVEAWLELGVKFGQGFFLCPPKAIFLHEEVSAEKASRS